ncbi:hypothetical protein [Streptomyces monomycini]|uniref:hypothetical protein n=1 Tax=Streptomyces monomycini TaxID=371720 RepID=UPI000998101C|nr:hypothetical protein [Streptomyces monomycini]
MPLVERLSSALPAKPVIGFVALLAVLFVCAYGAGSAAGPVAPGMRPSGTLPGAPQQSGAGDPSGGMDGMSGMSGMGGRG